MSDRARPHLVQPNWLDKTIAWIAPGAGVKRAANRRAFSLLTGYDGAEQSRNRKFSLNTRSGEALSKYAGAPLRNQARNLDRNHDIAKGGLDRLVDGMVGPNGINVEPQPKRKDGTIHTEVAAIIHRRYSKWAQTPEVTGMYDWIQTQRLSCRTWMRDGEIFGQLITGPRSDGAYLGDIPVAVEMLEPDFCPFGYDDLSKNIRNGIQRNAWGRPTNYYVYKTHPGDGGVFLGFGSIPAYTDLKPIPAANMLHLRLVDRFHQVRGVSVMASVVSRLQDIYEYQDFERIAAKMGASMVLKMTYGSPEMWGGMGGGSTPNTKDSLPIYQMDGGMVVVNTQPGSDAEFFDTKRPNTNGIPFVQNEMRFASAGFGLSYSSLSRDYNGTYSAQRQELVENRPGMEAGTMVMVAQLVRPVYESVVDWIALSEKLPADLDLTTIHDAQYVGPPMVWINPAQEADARLAMVSAGFTARSTVIRQLGGNPADVDAARAADNKRDTELGLVSLSNAAANVQPPLPPVAQIETGSNSPGGGSPSKGSSVIDIRTRLQSHEPKETA